MPRVFISFRKIDERWMRNRLYKALTSRFAADQFFKSGESISPGAKFPRTLMAQAESCEVMLILIGSRWLEASDETGRRLIDRKGDWVRREIASSISKGNRVVPVLLGDATMLPDPSQLPPDIAQIGELQARRVQETHLDAELHAFVEWVAGVLPDLRAATAPASEWPGASARADARSGSEAVPTGSPPSSTTPTLCRQVQMSKIHDINNKNGNIAINGIVITNRDPTPLDTMRLGLLDDDVEKRIEAATSLADDWHPDAIPDIIRQLWQEDCGEAQYWLVEALGNAGGDDAVRALTAFAKSEAAQDPLIKSRIDKALRTARRGGLHLAQAGRRGGSR